MILGSGVESVIQIMSPISRLNQTLTGK
uniref:Uncharacterized protein n=1 Tax=Anguilla anguilla TaxID=7936 RepID=A0A0E9S4X1_ANGAN